MESSLLLLSFAIGGVVWLCGFLTSGGGRSEARAGTSMLPRLWLIAAITVPILVFLATLPAEPPLFSAGHGLGAGFLIGGIAGLLAAITILRSLGSAGKGDPVSTAAAIAAPFGLALAVSAVPSLWFRGSLLDALCGIAIGWLCAALLVLSGLASQWRSRTTSSAALCIALSTAAATLLCALAGLGELRGPIDLVGKSSAILHWDAPGLAFAACVALILLAALLPAAVALRIPLVPLVTGLIERGRDSDEARAAARRGWRLGLSLFAIVLVGRLVAARFPEQGDEPWKTKSALLKPLFALLGPNPMFHVIALGVVAAIAICWLVRDHSLQAPSARMPQSLAQTNMFAALVLLAAGLLAFQLMGGFGLSLLVLVLLAAAGLAAAATPAGLHEETDDAVETADPVPAEAAATQLARLALFGAILTLYRLFTTRFESELRGVSITDHYALFGFLFGAVLPPLLTGHITRVAGGSADGDGSRLFRLVVTGLLLLATPTVILTLWGAKCALALMIGLAFSTLFETSLLSALLAVAAALALTQWMHHVLPLAQLTRDQKVNLVGWTTVITIAALIVGEFSGRWRAPSGRGVAGAAKGAAR